MTYEQLIQYDPSNRYFEHQRKRKQKLIFITYIGEIRGVISDILTYDLKLQGRQDLLPKHDILCVYKPDVEAIVKQILDFDKDVLEDEKQEAILKPRDRLQIPIALQHTCWKKKTPIRITLRNGWVFTGTILQYGLFSIRFSLDQGKARVIILKPNIYDFEKANSKTRGGQNEREIENSF